MSMTTITLTHKVFFNFSLGNLFNFLLTSLLKNKKWQLCLSFFIIIFTCLPSQVKANSFSSINKLANINRVIQDQQGFIWLAGQQGLTRFDGNNSITFSSSNSQWPLPFTWIHDISQVDGKFLLATEANGLWQFDPKTAKTKALLPEINQKSIYDVTAFKNTYYLNYMDSLYSYDPATGVIELIKDHIIIRNIIHTNKYLYISSKSGLFQLSNKTKTLKRILTEPIKAVTGLNSYVIATSQDTIYSISDTDIVISKKYQHKIYTLTKGNNISVQDETFFSANDIGKITKYSARTLKTTPNNYPDFKASHIRDMIQDSSGVLWLISNNGIKQLNKNTIKNHPQSFDIPINANELALVDDKIIIGSYGLGLQNFIDPIFTKQVNNNFTKKALRISDLQNVGDELFIATFDGLWQLNNQTKTVQRVNFIDNNRLILKLTLKKDKLYLATNYHGFYIYDLIKKQIVAHIDESNGLSSREVIDILVLDNNDIWLANSQGIDIYNKNSNHIKNIDVAGPNKVISVVTANNKVFASTLGDGIFVYNLQGELLSYFATGIRFNYMEVINDEIWIAARPGLYRLNPINNQLTMEPNTEDYSFVGSTLVHQKKLYSSHFTGVLSIPLTKPKAFNAKVFISQTTISGKAELLNESITVQSPNDVITLSLASLDYRTGQEKKYQYKINNGRWNPINSDQLTLTGLASGLYNIEIMATNSLGQWSANRAFTEIKVTYPWYWTPQIRLVYLILFVIVLIFTSWLLYLRTKSITRIHQLLTSDIQTRGKVALNVTYNLTLALEQLDQGNNEKANNLLQQSIADLTLSTTQQEPSILQGKSLNVALDYLSDYLHKKYHVNLTNTITLNESRLNDEIKADFYTIIYEALISAILNASGRNFTVSLKEHKEKIWLSIKDDANSFVNFDNKINFNLAMYSIRQITKKHHGVVNTFDEDVNGSQLLISMPFKKSITPNK